MADHKAFLLETKTAPDRFGSIHDVIERSERLQYGLAAVGTYNYTVARSPSVTGEAARRTP